MSAKLLDNDMSNEHAVLFMASFFYWESVLNRVNVANKSACSACLCVNQ